MNYKEKYLKYKIKYLKLNQIKQKKLKGGNLSPEIIRLIGLGSVGLFTILGILYKIFSKKEDEIESTDLDKLKLNQFVDHDDSLDKLKEQIDKSNNPIEIKQLEEEYDNEKKQKQIKIDNRTKNLEDQQTKKLQDRIKHQYNKQKLLLKNDSLDERRYNKLLENVNILEEKYEILFNTEKARRKDLILDDYFKKLEHDSLNKTEIERDYQRKLKTLEHDMINIDTTQKLYAVNFYLDYCKKYYLTSKFCEDQKEILKKYNEQIKSLIQPNENNNDFIKDIQLINKQIIKTKIEIEQIFEKNKSEDQRNIENTINNIFKKYIIFLEIRLRTGRNLQIYKEERQKIETYKETYKETRKNIISNMIPIKKALEEKQNELEEKQNELQTINKYSLKYIRARFDKDETTKKYLEDIKTSRDDLIEDSKLLKEEINDLKKQINDLNKVIDKLNEDSELYLSKVSSLDDDIENYIDVLIKKFLTTKERKYYTKNIQKTPGKIANWIRYTDVYKEYKDVLPNAEEYDDDHPDRTMSLGGKKTSS